MSLALFSALHFFLGGRGGGGALMIKSLFYIQRYVWDKGVEIRLLIVKYFLLRTMEQC